MPPTEVPPGTLSCFWLSGFSSLEALSLLCHAPCLLEIWEFPLPGKANFNKSSVLFQQDASGQMSRFWAVLCSCFRTLISGAECAGSRCTQPW